VKEPRTFDDVRNCEESDDREKCRMAIKKEFICMEFRKE
jgi:hypothetical protein